MSRGLLLLILCIPLWINGQVDVSIASEDIYFGVPDKLKLITPLKDENSNVAVDPHSFEGSEITVINADSISYFKSNTGIWTASIDVLFAIYDTGRVKMPQIRILLNGQDTLRSQSFFLEVLPLENEKELLNPIRPIANEPLRLSDLIPYGIVVLAIILVFFLYKWLRNRKKDQKIEVVPEQIKILTPFEEAINALEKLKTEQSWNFESAKEYYVELSWLIRRYLERSFEFPALESTSSEIEESFSRLVRMDPEKEAISRILRRADAVKYAKFELTKPVWKTDLQETEDLIRHLEKQLIKHKQEEE